MKDLKRVPWGGFILAALLSVIVAIVATVVLYLFTAAVMIVLSKEMGVAGVFLILFALSFAIMTYGIREDNHA